METNSTRLKEAMPDFGQYMDLASEIKELSVRKMKLENKIKAGEAETFKAVMNNQEYFVNGKPVSVSYFENAFKFSGVGGSLLALRDELAEVYSTLELKRNQFEVYRAMHEMFKTLVYQERVLT